MKYNLIKNIFVKYLINKTILILLVILCYTPVEIYGYKHITTENGLSNNRTFSVKKDNDGFVWFSTRSGIDRYDGSSIIQYNLLDNGNQDVTGRINKLINDKDGIIWAYTNYGHIFKYDKIQNKYVLILNVGNNFKNEDIYIRGVLFIDKNNFFVYGTFGLWVYNLKSKLLTKTLITDDVTIVGEIKPNEYAIGTIKGLYISNFSINKNNIKNLKNEFVGIKERVQFVKYEKNNNFIIIGTYNGKLLVYDITSKKNREDLSISGISIRDIESYANKLYIATDGKGLVCLNKDDMKSLNFNPNFGNEKYDENSNSLYDIFIDDNRLWISSYNGIFLYDNNQPSFNFIQTDNYRSYSDNGVNAVLEDSHGNLWIGTNHGIGRYNTKTNKWNYLFNNKSGYTILALCEDVNGDIWAGGALSRESAVCIDSRTLEIKSKLEFPNNETNVNTSKIYTIYSDTENNLWFGGLDNYLTKYNPITTKRQQYNLMFVNKIIEYNKNLLVATTHGLFVLNRSNDTFEDFLPAIKIKSKLQNYIFTMFIDNREILWLGTEAGLLKYDKSKNELNVFGKNEKTLSNNIHSILSDSRNRLWLSTDNGLICFDPANNDFTRYGTEEGLPDEKFKIRSGVRQNNGNLLFGTSKGILKFIPENINKLKVTNKIFLTEFELFYKPTNASDKNSPLHDVLDQTKSIILKHNQNTFAIGFSNINFTNPHSSKFEWMLEGYDENWISLTNDSFKAYYTNVQPGKYTFKVRLVDEGNYNETNIRSIPIEVLPPIWETVIAKIIYLIALLALLWIILQYIKSKIEKRTFAGKVQFFINTAHELKSPITLIKGPVSELKQSTNLNEDEQVLLNIASNNIDRLNRLVSQLLDLEKINLSVSKLVLYNKDVVSFIRNIIEPFQQPAFKKNISIVLNLPPHNIFLWFDYDKIEKIVNNLVSNALKYTMPNGTINVSLNVGQKEWYFEITDTGIGIPEKAQKDIFKPFYRAENALITKEPGTGIGLLLTEKLVTQHGGLLTFSSIEGKGSTFKVTFPIHYSDFDKKKFVRIDSEMDHIFEVVDDGISIGENSDSKPLIVIVEDNPGIRILLKQTLKDKYRVKEAENGIEAIKMVKTFYPELIITDIMMSGMNGYNLCKLIKTDVETSHIPVIILTVLDDKEDIIKGYEYGADNYITKPFDSATLRLTVGNTIFTRQSLRNNLILSLNEDVTDELTTNPLDKAFIDEAISIIDKNISDFDFSIDKLCREMAMSRSSFYNKLKVLTNESPNEFIRLVRLNRAASMLKEKKYTITEIAYSVGIGDVKYFSTAFKKRYGVSPSKYP